MILPPAAEDGKQSSQSGRGPTKVDPSGPVDPAGLDGCIGETRTTSRTASYTVATAGPCDVAWEVTADGVGVWLIFRPIATRCRSNLKSEKCA